jgi:hypothetical protein
VSTSADPTPREIAATDEDVEGSRPASCWSVREGDWRDELPDEVAALLAPPVIVSAEAFVRAVDVVPAVTVVPPVTVVPAVAVEFVVPAGQPAPASEEGSPAAYHPRHAAPEDARARFVTPARGLRRRRSAHVA